MFRSFAGRRAERDAAAAIYAAALAAARRPALYRNFGVPDTLQGRFEMIALHLFAVLHRLMHDPGDDQELARLVSERFVDDMDGALREMGVGDLSVPKKMRALYGSFAGRIRAYASALKEGPGALADAVARNVFPDDTEGLSDDAVERNALALAVNLRRAVEAMRTADLAELRRGALPFPELAEPGAAEDAP